MRAEGKDEEGLRGLVLRSKPISRGTVDDQAQAYPAALAHAATGVNRRQPDPGAARAGGVEDLSSVERGDEPTGAPENARHGWAGRHRARLAKFWATAKRR